jgi:CRP/FNR family cyclic AMP-dependent transcriptional regulator
MADLKDSTHGTTNRIRGHTKERVVASILKPLAARGLHRIVPAGTTLEFDLSLVWWIVKGSLNIQLAGNPIVSLAEGDVVGAWKTPEQSLSLVTSEETSCEMVGFPKTLISAELSKDIRKCELWAAFQSEMCAELFAAYVDLNAVLATPIPRQKRFDQGETIILEGEAGEEVFVLLKGAARVMLRGEPVGEIHEDEVFGALASLTDSARTATVIADEQCDCMIFTKDEFRDLLRTDPHLLTKLFSDFGRALHDLNDSVLKSHHTKWRNLF